YVSGSAPVRSPNELAGCTIGQPDSNPATALFRIEVIQVPLAHPEQAHIVSSPRIFHDLTEAPTSPAAQTNLAEEKRRGGSAREGVYSTHSHRQQDWRAGPAVATSCRSTYVTSRIPRG